jgi:hypothetical protein
MRKLVIASAAVGLALAAAVGLALTSQAQAHTVVAQGVVDQIAPDWMPTWIAFHIAGSGSCGGFIWYSGDQVGGSGTTEDVYGIVLASYINSSSNVFVTVYDNACDAFSVHLGP